eukprot:1162146-Pelagomonas_calceolata.AAC.6
MAILDVQFMKLPGWRCAAPYLFVTSHTAEYPMIDQDSIRATGVASSLIRNTVIKEVMLGRTVCAAYVHKRVCPYHCLAVLNLAGAIRVSQGLPTCNFELEVGLN